VTSSIGAAKERLRSVARERLASVPPAEREAKSALVAAAVARLDVVRRAERLLFHRALPSEVATDGMLAAVLSRGQRVFAPRVDGSRLTFLEIGHATRWRRSALGILEPEAGEALSLAVTEGLESVLLMPGLAFDERGGRLGRGGGHYDRFLREARRKGGGLAAIAMAFELQMVADVPLDAQDELVDWIVTEARVIDIAGRRGEPSPSEQ
jgi:5-formyltetrahydrofolate cyclo-ligase